MLFEDPAKDLDLDKRSDGDVNDDGLRTSRRVTLSNVFRIITTIDDGNPDEPTAVDLPWSVLPFGNQTCRLEILKHGIYSKIPEFKRDILYCGVSLPELVSECQGLLKMIRDVLTMTIPNMFFHYQGCQ